MSIDIGEMMKGLPWAAELDPDAVNDEKQLLINWSKPRVGFGQLLFKEEDGAFTCDNETMGRAFCKSVLEKLTEGKNWEDLPEFIRRFPTLDTLLDACVPRHPVPGWGGKE